MSNAAATDFDVRDLFSALATSGPPPFFAKPAGEITFDFDQGLAAPETFPTADLVRLTSAVLQEAGPAALEYFDPRYGYAEMTYGSTVLRRALADRLAVRDGRRPDEDGLMLASGSVQALALAIGAFLGPGDAVIVEAASFPYALRYMAATGARVYTVPVDDDGMDVAAVERRLDEIVADGLRPKMVYTIATFQLPTGMVLSLERRRALVELAERWRMLVVEDNVYGDLRYAGHPLPTLLALDHSGLVLQVDSFSKTVAPALRLGWIAGAPPLVAGLAAVRQDLGVSQLLSLVMARYLDEGLLDPHLARANAVYRVKRDAAVAAVRAHCAPWLSFRVPDGGFYLWLEMADGIDADAVQNAAAAEGVYCRPGEMFTTPGDGRRFLRMAFSHVSVDEIERGVQALGRALAAAAR